MSVFGNSIDLNGTWLTINLQGLSMRARRELIETMGSTVEVVLKEGRVITPAQRAKIYALISEIATEAGYHRRGTDEYERLKWTLKKMYMEKVHRKQMFSLSDCQMSMASEFLEFLIEFCFAWEIPFASRTVDAIREQPGWDYYCLKYRKCTICGNPADIAHIHAVGMGRDRQHISHVGNDVMALCRVHHQEQHQVGIHRFMDDHKIKGLRVTPEIAKMLKLGNWRQEQGDPIISTTEDYKNE